MPYLEIMTKGSDERLAARAVSFASRTNDPRSADLLRTAATSVSPRIRIQVAYGARHLPREVAEHILSKLTTDSDMAVRSITVKTLRATFPPGQMPASLAAGLS